MSARELRIELTKLTATERREVLEFLRSLEQADSKSAPGRLMSHQEALDHVFSEHSELLHRLAQ